MTRLLAARFFKRLAHFGAVILACVASLHADATQIWFAPLDDVTRLGSVSLGIIPSEFGSATDFLQLFDAAAPWPIASSRVAVFKMYAPAITGNEVAKYSDAQLRQIFTFLNSRGIALAVEFGPLTPGTCGNGIEGFTGQIVTLLRDRIKANGGILKYVSMDEPFFFGNIYSGTQACRWSPQQIAQNAQISLNVLRAAFPGLEVGDTEPVPGFGAADWVQRYSEWMDAWRVAAGKPLAFFHVDTGFTPNWLADVATLRTETAKRLVPLGMIYNGEYQDRSDTAWFTHAEELLTQQELINSQPEHAIFQSWHPFPRTMLPESGPNTFTWLINRYFRPRPKLSLSTTTASAFGTLTNEAGAGLSGAPVTVTATPLKGPGVTATYTLTGVVPATNSRALIQICVNVCGNVPKAHDITTYSFDYVDSATSSHFDFVNGLTGWGWNTASASVLQTGVDADGPYLRTIVTAAQNQGVNSGFFTVTPGSPFTLTVRARIPPSSADSGTFALIFTVDNKETSRQQLPYAPATVSLGMPTTASDGSYAVPVTASLAGEIQLRASFAGTNALFPALATVTQTFCTFSLNPPSANFGAGAVTGSLSVTASDPSCTWATQSNAPWLTITSPLARTGTGAVNYSVAANTGTSERRGTLTVAGQTFTVTQAGAAPTCTFGLSATSANFGSSAGNGSVTVNTGTTCAWTVLSNATWLTITTPAGGTGVGIVTYTVASNGGSAQRSGTITIAGVVYTVTQAGGVATLLAPTNLVASVVGNTVTASWTMPAGGIAPTGFVVEGGISAGDVLGSLPTGSTAPSFSFTAPTGLFYLRVHSLAGATRSAPSNEVWIAVNVPLPPAAPAELVGEAFGSQLRLAWRNRLHEGTPTATRLDVSGAVTLSMSLSVSESFSFSGVPPGTYTFVVRALNASGVSPASNAITLTFPAACVAANTPTNVTVTRAGNVVTVSWSAPASGPTPTGYLVAVTGAASVTVPVSQLTLSGAAGPGTYSISVLATHPCGASAASPAQTMVIP